MPCSKKSLCKALSIFLAMVIIFCFTMGVFDLILRPILKTKLYYRPEDMFVYRLPSMPLLTRYAKNVSYQGKIFGDLAASFPKTESEKYRQEREVVFKTDALGFRNEKLAIEKNIDVIVLGDSFGEGSGVSQEKTLASILSNQYGLNAYNLSIPGGPWQELMNLKVTLDKLKTNKNTTVLWLLFTGNDLDDEAGSTTEIVYNSQPKQWLVSLRTFIKRSPIFQLVNRLKKGENESRNSITIKDFLGGKKMLFLNTYLERKDRLKQDILEHKNYETVKKVFQEVKKIADEKNLNIKVISLPVKAEVYPWVLKGTEPWVIDAVEATSSGFAVAMEDLSHQQDLPFLDLKPFLQKKAQEVFEKTGEILWWYDDTHWNDMGHKTVAEIIYEDNFLPIVR